MITVEDDNGASVIVDDEVALAHGIKKGVPVSKDLLSVVRQEQIDRGLSKSQSKAPKEKVVLLSEDKLS